MKNLFLFLVAVTFCATTNAQCINESLIQPDGYLCNLMRLYVCGCNGKTYSNPCHAESGDGVTSYTIGHCLGDEPPGNNPFTIGFEFKNDFATVYDFSSCLDYTNLENCDYKFSNNNLAAEEALNAVTKAAEYFLNVHNILLPPVNIVVNNTEYPNSSKYYIKENVIMLGAGDGVERNSMAVLDIIAHEYSHAIFNSINYLGNYGIPGALNESYADIFAELIEYACYGTNDWIFGSQVMAGNNTGIRNLSNPKDETMEYPMPDTYQGEFWTFINDNCVFDDNCGIHTNSGVHSYWFYLLANGGTGINDNGFTYNLNGIGIEKATTIIMDNIVNHLNPQSSLSDARTGSIEAAFKLYPNQPQVFISVIEAWGAVGLNDVVMNPIKFELTNGSQTGPVIVEDDITAIPIEFDLSIDSLGMDICANELCFNMQLPDTYTELNIDTIYFPLTAEDISITYSDGEVNVEINRSSNGIFYPKIVSNCPILRFKTYIVSEDVGGEDSGIEPINISSCPNAASTDIIIFEPTTLQFDFNNRSATINPCANSFETNYSGSVALDLDNNQNILKNSYVTVYDYSTCQNYTNLENCNPVIGNNNLSANEALWAATETAKYFLEKHNFQMPHVNIIVNCSKEPNDAAYKLGHNTIVLGKGDNIKYTSMTAVDIVAHEMVHHFIAFISNEEFGLYGETGALQESFADIFAEAIEREINGTNDWVIGKDVTIGGKGIRSFKNPNSFEHPDTYNGKYWIDLCTCYNIDDKCGVHTNNSILNYWFYLLSEGGKGKNDFDCAYEITAIGIENATEIIFKSLPKFSKMFNIYINMTFSYVKSRSIESAFEIFGFNSQIEKQIRSAWDAIGISELCTEDFNLIKFRTANYSDVLIDGTIQIKFDLIIDSVCQDITADGLQITFDTKGQYENLEILTVYPPLAVEDTTVSQSNNYTTVKIERNSGQFKKSHDKLSKIKSGDPIFRMIACVLEDDIPIDSTSTKPMDISGFSSSRNGSVNFEDHSLVFMNPFGNTLNLDGTKILPAKFTINHQNCRTLGSVDISILTNEVEAPFTYSIIDVSNDAITYTADTNKENHTIFNLEQGNYQLEIQDKNSKKGLFELIVKFNATFDSSINCLNDICPSFLSVNYNNIKGIYSAQKEIEIKGSIEDIKEDVIFSVCE